MAPNVYMYGRPIAPSTDGGRFVCTAYVPRHEVYVGFPVDEQYLPIPREREPYFRVGGQSALIGAYSLDGVFMAMTPDEASRYGGLTQGFGPKMSLAELADVASYVAERDVFDSKSCLRPEILARVAADAVVHLACDVRIVGGPKLDGDVRNMHELLGAARLDHLGRRNSRFLDAWTLAWSGDQPGRRAYGEVSNLVTDLVTVMIEESAVNAVRTFAVSGRKPV